MVTKSLKRKRIAPPEEINFDFTARHEYLTGFHKRKLQRAKHAQEAAAKKEREDRIEARRILREKRAAKVQEHVDTINKMTGNVGKSSEDETAKSESDDQEWEGFAEPALVDHGAEYVDEDRYTTVTVEAVAVKHDGLHRVHSDSSDTEVYEDDQNEDRACTSKATEFRQEKIKSKAKRVWTKENPKQGKKKKRKKFRYETKAERSATRLKEEAKNSAQATLRRQRA